MKEGQTYRRVFTTAQAQGVLVVSIRINVNGEASANVGRTITANWTEGEMFTDVRAALAYASAELGAPGVDEVVVYFEDNNDWKAEWGDWTT